MFAILAAIIFALALVLELLGVERLTTVLALGGLLCLALATIGIGPAWPRRA